MKKKRESQEADGESMTITIENEASKELPFDYKALIERVVMGCMDYEKCPYEAEVNVLLTNNEEIHKINKECSRPCAGRWSGNQQPPHVSDCC